MRGAILHASASLPCASLGGRGRLASLRGAFFMFGIRRTEIVFRKLGLSKWTWSIDVAQPRFETRSKKCPKSVDVTFMVLSRAWSL